MSASAAIDLGPADDPGPIPTFAETVPDVVVVTVEALATLWALALVTDDLTNREIGALRSVALLLDAVGPDLSPYRYIDGVPAFRERPGGAE